MGKTVWNPRDCEELKARVRRLNATRTPEWGRFTAQQMVVHLCDSLRMASGELPTAPKNKPIRHPPLKQLIIYWLPFPRNVQTAPELLIRTPGEFASDVGELVDRLESFVKAGPAAAAAVHPLFGRMNGRLWGVLVYRHMHHHLAQFGV
jgi:hypothetical protein